MYGHEQRSARGRGQSGRVGRGGEAARPTMSMRKEEVDECFKNILDINNYIII